MEVFINNITTENVSEFSKHLEKFCKENAQTMQFPELNKNNLREMLWNILMKKLADEKYSEIHEKCIETLRILSRDKTHLDDLITDERLELIVTKADLVNSTTSLNSNVTLEAVKLLCNLIYNSAGIQIQIAKVPWLANLIKRISIHNQTASYKMLLFDVRILFLVTALNVTSRNIIKNQLDGSKELTNLLKILSDKIRDGSKDIVDISCEILKTLFNLYIIVDESNEDEKQESIELIHILHKLLILKNFESRDELLSHVVNLLTVIPSSCYDVIISPVETKSKTTEVYENADMSAIYELIQFLDRQLVNQRNIVENVSPIVTALLKLSRSKRLIRKYTRQKVLPPLHKKDIMMRPEEGSTLRAKLCKLLTSPLTELRGLVAEFLFVLCKENVGRMIKYTGYGNAAGMFANKGLLNCKQPKTDYSSESEESDTEDYAKYKEAIDPVTGCYEQPKSNPFEGMSEERKEYEAMKLVNLINQLTNEGHVRPCTIGEDGKPKPVEHVLELQGGFKDKLNIHEDESG
ncbi:synembryn [Chelonus insularis]|uniref:synembryn n=1 Tax=Chelonus insularis TaxID=460826 RepID=UPI00158C89CC|nr:synembryn [Chelonus insularis]XP_034949833.1 synembryn [Chelonus insularis]